MIDHRAFHWGRIVLPAALAVLLAVAPVAAAIFTDIQGLPMQRAIERLAAKGIFRGTSGTTFNPNGTVSRADLAVLLVRTLGLDAQGVSLPAFKDAAEIARDQVSSVAGVTNMGSVSPTIDGRGKVETKKGGLVYTLATDKAVYSPGDTIKLTFTLANTSDKDLKFDYATTQLYDFIIRGPTGEEIAKWSIGHPFPPVDQPLPLAAGKQFVWETRWKQLDQSDDPVAPGRYEIIAIHTTKSNPTSLSLFFNKGVMTAFPDNTFRPKDEITRLELATVAARAIGLGDAGAALAASDASAVPAASRGTVAAAVEKHLIALIGREFRPTQKATRAEVAQALDGLMDAVKRYNFSKGVLKDPVAGNPPQITIEDDRKALRTYRVARNVAVYRNDRPAELRDLRPGDVVLFLNVGDVGDVAYIEATGR